MPDFLIVEGGIVVRHEHAALSDADTTARLAAVRADIARMEDDPAAARAAVVARPMIVAPEHEADYRERTAAQILASLEAEAERLSLPSAALRMDAAVYAESTIGSAVVWPRAYRDACLAATDYVEVAGWRSTKGAEVLAAADAYRAALRGLPAAYPDAATVVWPAKPAGI